MKYWNKLDTIFKTLEAKIKSSSDEEQEAFIAFLQKMGYDIPQSTVDKEMKDAADIWRKHFAFTEDPGKTDPADH